MRKRKGSWCPHLLALSVVDERLYLHCLEESHAQKQQACWVWGGSICVGASKAFEPEVRFSCVTLRTLPCRTEGGSPQRSSAQNIIVGKRELTGTDNKHGFCSWLWRACAAMLLNIRAFVNKAGRERCCVCHAIYIMAAA